MARTHAEAQARRMEIGRYAKEHGTKAAMEKFDVPYALVRHGLRDIGSSTWEAIEVAEEARENGIASAMSRFGMSENEVIRRCRLAGVSWKPRRGRTDRVFGVIAMLLKGKPQLEVAEELQVSRQYVNEIKQQAEKAGIQFPGAKDEHAVSGE
jgi:hypothetical protein